MSKHASRPATLPDWHGLRRLKRKALVRTGKTYPIIMIQEAGLDGFWLHRVLEEEGSRAMWSIPPRSRRRAGDGGPRRTRSMARRCCGCCWPTSAASRGCVRWWWRPRLEEEDRRRICRERQTLIEERVAHVNRIKGLLFSQGISDYAPLRRDRRARLEELRTGDGRALAAHLKAQISRELDRLELLLEQIKAVEAERDAMLCPGRGQDGWERRQAARRSAMLLGLKGIGRGFRRRALVGGALPHFANRRQVGRLCGSCGDAVAQRSDRARAGRVEGRQSAAAHDDDPTRLAVVATSTAIGAGALVFGGPGATGKARASAPIVALARKLLVALWKYVDAGVVIEGAVMKIAA